jgi:uncharacterized protein with ParB-like and HNH nuclease domain
MLRAKEKTIYNLFKNSYTIPNYQRGYEWKKKEVETLIDDLLDALKQEKDFYFLSTITLCTSGEYQVNDQVNVEYVIDGQQRLITLTLLIFKLYKSIAQNQNTETVITRLKNCYINVDNEIPQLRLKLDNNDDNQTLNSILIEGDDVNVDARNKINVSANVIQERIEVLNEEGRIELGQFLLSKVYVIKSRVETEEHACQIFESLNDRGQSLNAYDLIKNRLFLLGAAQRSEEINNKIREIQTSIHAILPDGRSLTANIRDYFRIFLQVNGECDKNYIDNVGMYTAFKGRVNTGDEAVNFLRNLTNTQNLNPYFSLKTEELAHQSLPRGLRRDPDFSHMQHYFNFLTNYNICHPVLFSLFYQAKVEKIKSGLQDLYCLMTRLTLLKHRPAKIQDMLSRLACKIYNAPEEEDLTELLETEVSDNYDDYLDEAFKATLRTTRMSAKDSKDILFDICQFTANTMVNFDRPYNILSQEHILPRNRIQGDYSAFTDDLVDYFLENLGNHTILVSRDNSYINNSSIDVKLEVFEGTNKNAEDYSAFPVVNNIREYLVDNEWTIESIKSREQDLINKYVDSVKFSWQD